MLVRMDKRDSVIVGSGPAGLGAAFALAKAGRKDILLIDKTLYSSGGLRNDCKMNFTWPIGFSQDVWTEAEAERCLALVREDLNPPIKEKRNLDTYERRSDKVGARLLRIAQAHLGTDGGLALIKELVERLRGMGVELSLGEFAEEVDGGARTIRTDKRTVGYRNLILAPGRGGFSFLQGVMRKLGVPYTDNVIDVGIRVETRIERYPVVHDYYDPKFLFPEKTRTFCTNSGFAQVVQESYETAAGQPWTSVNGHAFSDRREPNGLVNFAMLRSVSLTEPLASGQSYAEMLGLQAWLLGGGHPIMQRVGDFRMGKRSTRDGFNGDLYDFEPTLASATPGDLSLAMPSKFLRSIWKAMKQLDTIVPGVLHPSTVMYYPEIKLYANRPRFIDGHFQAAPGVYLVGDGAGTSRGITGAWASGILAAEGILAGG